MAKEFEDDLDDLFGDEPKKKEEKPEEKKPDINEEEAKVSEETAKEEKTIEVTDELTGETKKISKEELTTPPETEKPPPEEDTARIDEEKLEAKETEPPKKEEAVEDKKEETPTTPETETETKDEKVETETEVDDLFGEKDEKSPKEEKPPKPPTEVATPEVTTAETSEFDTSPEEGIGKPVILPYGHKGFGKTFLTFSLPGKHSVICFDQKSQSIAMKYQKKEGKKRITVHNADKYYDELGGETVMLESAHKTIRFINVLLDDIEKEKPDWVVIDGGVLAHKIMEMEMRYRHDLRPYGGVKNLNVWKYRNTLVSGLLNRAINIAKVGVVWTCYLKERNILEDGELITVKEQPNWIDQVLTKTDVVIRVDRKTVTDGQHFYATVETSKWDAIPETPRMDITDTGFEKLFTEEAWKELNEEVTK